MKAIRQGVVLMFVVAGLGIACDSKERSTRAAADLAVKALDDLTEQAAQRKIEEQIHTRKDTPLDWVVIAEVSVKEFIASPAAHEPRNPFDPARPVFVAGSAKEIPGTIYIDAAQAKDGLILVTGILPGAGGMPARVEKMVRLRTDLKPKPVDSESGVPGAL